MFHYDWTVRYASHDSWPLDSVLNDLEREGWEIFSVLVEHFDAHNRVIVVARKRLEL